MLTSQLKDYILNPVLNNLNLHSDSAVNLMLGTAAQETQLGKYVRQMGYNIEDKGGAFGIYQIELKTCEDTLSYLNNNYPKLFDKVENSIIQMHSLESNLITNLYFQTAIARCLYYSIKVPLPHADNIEGLADYWNKYYNRNPEKGTNEEFILNYEKYVKGEI